MLDINPVKNFLCHSKPIWQELARKTASGAKLSVGGENAELTSTQRKYRNKLGAKQS